MKIGEVKESKLKKWYNKKKVNQEEKWTKLNLLKNLRKMQ